MEEKEMFVEPFEERTKNKEMVAPSNATTQPKQMNIYQKMSAITTKLSHVAKNLEVGFGASKYKAVGEADVLRAIKPLESEFGIYSYPYNRSIIETGTLESAKGTKQIFERIEVVYRFVNVENPEEYIDIISYGDGLDSGDKSVGKAMTYADKYALMKAYKIITGDDPDQNISEDMKEITVKKNTLNSNLLNKARDLKISLDKVAIYANKNINELTDYDLASAIDMQLAALNKKAGKL